MIFIFKFKSLDTNFMDYEIYGLYLNEVRKNLAASANCSCVALPPTIPVGDPGRSPLIALFPLSIVPFMQYTG